MIHEHSEIGASNTAFGRKGAFWGEAGLLIGEYDESGEVIREYIWLGDRPVAMLDSSGNIHYIHSDHLNTPKVVTDDAQTAVWKGDYSPFGEVEETISTIEFNLRFSGQYYDAETRLNYNYFRSYNPATGRYTQSDPIGLRGGLNTYRYANASPVRFYDPDGLEVRFICRDLAGAASATGKEHCFVFVSCPEENWQTTLSLFGSSRPEHQEWGLPTMGFKVRSSKTSMNPDNPFSDDNTFNEAIEPDKCSSSCGYEKAVVERFNSFPDGFVPYDIWGPNSNSFAQDLATGTDYGGSLPAGAPGPSDAPGIDQPHPNFP